MKTALCMKFSAACLALFLALSPLPAETESASESPSPSFSFSATEHGWIPAEEDIGAESSEGDLIPSAPAETLPPVNDITLPAVSPAPTIAVSPSAAPLEPLPDFLTTAEFQRRYGCSYLTFVPSRPVPGAAFLIIRDSAQTAPRTLWSEQPVPLSFRRALTRTLRDMTDALGEDAPHLTDDPEEASWFLFFDMQYPYYHDYGKSHEIKGYGCELTLSLWNPFKAKRAARISIRKNLLPVIYSWDNGIAAADPPILSEQPEYAAFIEKARAALESR